jgi:chromosome segregation ATPase
VSSSDIAAKLENIEQQIDEKEAERDRLRAALPRLLAEHTGPGMAAARERKALDDLDRYLTDLGRAREALLAELAQAEAREEAERVATAFARSEHAAAQLLEAAAALQGAITSVVSAAKAVQGADAEFCKSLARTPSDFQPRQLSIALANRIQLSLYVVSGGLLRVHGLFENVYQLKQSGRADLPKIAAEYTELALRGNRVQRTEERPA